MASKLTLDRPAIEAFCRRWKVVELSLFGSLLREGFGAESDVDVLVTFAPDARRSLFVHHDMQAELAEIVGHPVDIVSREAVEQSPNWIRRRAVLESAELFYAA